MTTAPIPAPAHSPWPAAQALMAQLGLDAWIVYDFRGSNTLLAQLLPGRYSTTRRAALVVPRSGPPTLLVQGLDVDQFVPACESLGVRRELYLGWRDFHAQLRALVGPARRVAMEYSPGAALPVNAVVDAGTIELVRAMGYEVVSSADLVQGVVAVWSESGLAAHRRASEKTGRIVRDAFAFIGARLDSGVTEHDAARYILERFASENLETADAPIVAVNEHSGNPHFEVSATSPAKVRRGDWVMIDLWARERGTSPASTEEHIYSDITWMGFAGDPTKAPPEHLRVWDTVRGARDAAVRCARDAFAQNRAVQGWELDEAARQVIIAAGYEHGIKHRTGHSLSRGPRVHGLGVNIDNLETRDTRSLIPGIGFTIEPGVYLPAFGCRSEINVYIDPVQGPVVTSVQQDELVRIG